MKINEAIKEIMRSKGITQKKLQEEVNRKAGKEVIKSQSVMAERLKRNNAMQIDKAYELLDALDYEIVIQPKSTRGKRANGAYVVNLEDGEGE